MHERVTLNERKEQEFGNTGIALIPWFNANRLGNGSRVKVQYPATRRGKKEIRSLDVAANDAARLSEWCPVPVDSILYSYFICLSPTCTVPGIHSRVAAARYLLPSCSFLRGAGAARPVRRRRRAPRLIYVLMGTGSAFRAGLLFE